MKLMKTGIVLLGAMIGLILAGCPQPEDLSSDATLARINVAGVTATLGTPSEDWATAAEAPGKVYLSFNQMGAANVEAAKGEDGQTLFYSHVKPGVMPYFENGTTFDFDSTDFLYIEVFSANHDKFLIYAIQVIKKTPTITDITLAGRSASGGSQLNGIPIQQFGKGVGTPGPVWNDPAITEGEVWFGTSQSGTDLALTVTPEVPGTLFEYAVVDNAAATPKFIRPPESGTLNIKPVNGQYLYIKSKSIDASQPEEAYYKIKLTAKSDDLSIDNVTINRKTVTKGMMGTHSFPGSEAYGSYSNGAELAPNNGSIAIIGTGGISSVTIVVGTKPTGSTIKYGYTPANNERNYLIDFTNTTGTLSSLPDGAFIALEVNSELGTTGWYKFQIYEKDIDNSVQSIKLGTTNITANLQPGTTVAVLVPDLSSVGAVSAQTSKSSAKVKYGLGTTGGGGTIQAPTGDGWKDNGNLFTGAVIAGTVVYVQITAENPAFVNTYSFVLYTEASVGLSSLSIGGTPVSSLGTPAGNPTGVTAPGAVTLPVAVAAGTPDYTGQPVISTVVTVALGLSYRIAQTKGTAVLTENDWKASISFWGMVFPPTFNPIANNDALWVEISAGTVKRYYKIAVTVTG